MDTGFTLIELMELHQRKVEICQRKHGHAMRKRPKHAREHGIGVSLSVGCHPTFACPNLRYSSLQLAGMMSS